jgi:hypothetical protein
MLFGQTGAVTAALLPTTSTKIPGTRAPIDAKGRIHWVLKAALGPDNLIADALFAGVGTADNNPKEYGTHWEGFGHRFGNRVLYGATSATIEAAAGSLWGEDPRYMRATGQPLSGRVKNVVISAFMARNREGERMPAYARYIAYAGGTFLSNEYRPPSETSMGDTLARIPISFAARMGKNAFSEFFPDLKRRVFGAGN